MDYRALLAKYTDHVAEHEGTDFLREYDSDYAHLFTPEEWAELREISDEGVGREAVRQALRVQTCEREGHYWVRQIGYYPGGDAWRCARCALVTREQPTMVAR